MNPHDALEKYFSYPAFRPGQEEALTHVLEGNDALVVMPTGSGKSLIYQLAGLMMDGTALVFSPLIALMKDQVDSMTRRGIPATYINSSLELAEQGRRVREMVQGKYKLMLIAPERLRSPNFQAALRQTKISMLTIDEAHCLSQWGHDFRPDYLHIAKARQDLRPRITLALTATATPRAQGDIMDLLGLPEATRFINGFNRPNLFFEVLPAPDNKSKFERVRQFLGSPAAEGAGIIYAATRRETEEVSAFVSERLGLKAQHYHAGLNAATRAQVQDAFLAGDLPIVIATNAFGMGIDRPDVRFVLHFNMPGSLEAYYQEAGRAGRDGLPARATLLYGARDAALQEHFIDTSAPSEEELRRVHALIQKDGSLDADAIAERTGLRDTTVRVAMEQLALAKGEIDGDALRQLMRLADMRKDHKRMLLRTMAHYAQTEDCRRRVMLDYFGDDDATQASVCCDNCLLGSAALGDEAGEVRQASSQSERAALIVLDTVAIMSARDHSVGKGKLSQILKGSEAQDMARYTSNRNYAKFTALRLTDIESLVSQLISAGYLKQTGGERPTLQLSRRGEAALKARAAVDVTLRPVSQEKVVLQQRQREAGHTIELTRQMLQAGSTPDRVAAERSLSIGTIYSHCAQLISEGLLDLDMVVPNERQITIRAAIQTIGSADALSPIKAILPAWVDYGQIRCVAEAWKRTASGPAAQRSGDGADPALFQKLREWRTSVAKEANVPPYVIFSDEVLRGLSSVRPRDRETMLDIKGIGEVKIERYGEAVLRIVATHEGEDA